MKLEAAQILASIVNSSPDVYPEPPTLTAGNSAFANTSYDGLYECSKGFDTRYGKPASKGGRYMTLTDLRMMYYMGTSFGKRYVQNINNPYYDSDFCKSIGGYPKGAIIRHSNGKKMVSRVNGNITELPEEYATNSKWAIVKAKPRINREYSWDNDSESYIPIGGDLESKAYIAENTANPYVISFSCELEEGGLFYFPMYFQGSTGGYYPYVWDFKLLDLPFSYTQTKHAELELRVSRYDDIMTNDEHSDSYLTIGRETMLAYESVPVRDGNISYRYYNYLNRISTAGLIPLGDGTWYFYLVYTNGGPKAPVHTFKNKQYQLRAYNKLVARKYSRQLEWPTY